MFIPDNNSIKVCNSLKSRRLDCSQLELTLSDSQRKFSKKQYLKICIIQKFSLYYSTYFEKEHETAIILIGLLVFF